MTQGLSVSRLVSVSVNLAPLAAQFRSFNTLLIMGTSDVINVDERIRSFDSLNSVASAFGVDSDEYDAALLYFSQIPQPSQVYIGRWADTATHGLNICGILTTAQQSMVLWNAIDDGAFSVAFDGAPAQDLTGLDFTGAANLNNVATIIQSALVGATCVWDTDHFVISSDTTGVASTVSFTTSPGGGGVTDLSPLVRGTDATGATLVDGIAAETARENVAIMDDLNTQWYAIMYAAEDPTFTEAMALDVAGYVQGATNKHIFGYTTFNTDVINSAITNDICSTMSDADYTRSVVQYSENPYAIASFFGRALTTNFAGNNTTITMMYKVEPGVVPQSLTSSQADTLQDKRCNVYVNYNNDTAIIQYATVEGSAWFDEIHGLDWLSDQIQTNVFNALYTSSTKIPQTDAGNNILATVITAALDAGVNNGLLGPGQWNSAGFGQLKQGDFLAKGYYVYVPPISSQAQADREARKSVVFQIAVKLAGAIQTVDIIVNVNR